MDLLSSRLAELSVRFRSATFAIVLIISAGAAVGYIDPRLVWDLFSSVEAVPQEVESTSVDGQAFQRPPPNVKPLSLSAADAVVVVEGKDFFTSGSVEALRDVVESLEALDHVRAVVWMDRVPILNIFGLPQPLLPKPNASTQRFEAARRRAAEHPLVSGQLLSGDGRTLLLLVYFDYFHLLDDTEATSKLRTTAELASRRSSKEELQFRVTGRIPTMIAAVQSHESNQLKYQLVGYGMILLMTLILFRGIRAVIIVSLAPTIGVIWTLGYIRFLDIGNNPLVDVILPILVSLVGLTDGVHLMVQIRKLRASGMNHRRAAAKGLSQVGTACFLTSFTTAIGLGSLILADSQLVQEFGLCSTVGVLLCFLSVVTIIPLACSTPLGARIHVGHENSLIDKNLERISSVINLVLRRRVLFSCLGILATVTLGALSLTLAPDQRQSNALPEAAEATQAMQHVDRAFGGLEYSSIDIHWDENVESDSPQVLEVLSAVDDLLKLEPLIGHPLSLRNLIDAQPGTGPASERMTLIELLPPPLKRAFYTPEYRQANVSFRVQDLGIAKYGPVFERIEQGLSKIKSDFPGFNLQMTGSAVWRWRNLYQIVVDLASSLGAASVIILITLAVVYRSIRLGLISIVPNMFPLALTGTYLLLAGYNLEIVMVCSFTVCLGIAVDDTIHFLTRYREELAQINDHDLAIKRAFTGVGTALIMTTTVLVAGFSSVLFSDSRDHRIFASMGMLTISAALFCDLVFLPAMLSYFAKQKDIRQSDAST